MSNKVCKAPNCNRGAGSTGYCNMHYPMAIKDKKGVATMNRYIEGLNYPVTHPFRKESQRLLDSFESDVIKSDGVLRWKSNGRVPPQDILDFWKYVGYRFNMQRSERARNREEKARLEQYKKANSNRQYTEEELCEMRSVYGKGATVVDVVTGKRTKL